jgi:hypothetical protein
MIKTLKSLDISRLTLITDSGFEFMNSLDLEYLNVGGTPITNRVLLLFMRLKILDISCCYLLDDVDQLGTEMEIITDSLEPGEVDWLGT